MEIYIATGSFIASSGCLFFAWVEYRRNKQRHSRSEEN